MYILVNVICIHEVCMYVSKRRQGCVISSTVYTIVLMHVLRYMWYICGIVCTFCSILDLGLVPFPDFALHVDKATQLPNFPSDFLFPISIFDPCT